MSSEPSSQADQIWSAFTTWVKGRLNTTEEVSPTGFVLYAADNCVFQFESTKNELLALVGRFQAVRGSAMTSKEGLLPSGITDALHDALGPTRSNSVVKMWVSDEGLSYSVESLNLDDTS